MQTLLFTKKPFPIYYFSLLEINTRRILSKFKNPLKNFTAKRCLKWLIKKYFKEEIYFNTLVLRKLRKQNFKVSIVWYGNNTEMTNRVSFTWNMSKNNLKSHNRGVRYR